MEYKANPWTIGLAVVITAVIVGGGIFLFQNRTAEVQCPQDWTRHESQNLSFCYNNSWGAPKLADKTYGDGKDRLFKIGFSNEQDIDVAPTTPQLWWKTKDSILSVTNDSNICFECINFNQSESEIIKALGYEERNATAQKVSIDGKNALRVKTDYFETFDGGSMFEQEQVKINRLEYFVPNAFGDYHFQALVSYSKADELDNLMKSLTFKE